MIGGVVESSAAVVHISDAHRAAEEEVLQSRGDIGNRHERTRSQRSGVETLRELEDGHRLPREESEKASLAASLILLQHRESVREIGQDVFVASESRHRSRCG